MRDIVEEILVTSRDASSQEPVERTDLVALAESVVANYADFGEKVLLSPPETPMVVACRRFAIRRALDNLIANAVRHGETVTVALEQHERDIRLIIEDDGPGISDEEMRRLQQPFGAGLAGNTKGGFGLGLSIVRAIMEGHGGSLELKRRGQGGLRAVLSLPL